MGPRTMTKASGRHNFINPSKVWLMSEVPVMAATSAWGSTSAAISAGRAPSIGLFSNTQSFSAASLTWGMKGK